MDDVSEQGIAALGKLNLLALYEFVKHIHIGRAEGIAVEREEIKSNPEGPNVHRASFEDLFEPGFWGQEHPRTPDLRELLAFIHDLTDTKISYLDGICFVYEDVVRFDIEVDDFSDVVH